MIICDVDCRGHGFNLKLRNEEYPLSWDGFIFQHQNSDTPIFCVCVSPRTQGLQQTRKGKVPQTDHFSFQVGLPTEILGSWKAISYL